MRVSKSTNYLNRICKCSDMKRTRVPISTILFLLIIIMIIFSTFFESLSSILFLGLIVVATVLILMRVRQRGEIPPKSPPPYYFKPSRPPTSPTSRLLSFPKIGKWVILPIALIGVIAFILFQNWWLSVTILQSIYTHKAGLDWWKIHFLDNHYFYACLGVGLLIALSDPRISIVKDPDGKRRIFLHSKFISVIKILRNQIFQYTREEPFSVRMKGLDFDDKVSLKVGVGWKILEFVVGSLVIGPTLAQGLALKYLVVTKWIETQQLSWLEVLQRAATTLWTRIFAPGLPNGAWLIENSPVLEFLEWFRTIIIIICVIWGLRHGMSLIFGVLRGNIVKAFRSAVLIGLAVLTPFVLRIPTQVFDITTPFYMRTIVFGELILIALTIFFSLKESFVQRSIALVYRRKIVLTVMVLLVSLGLLFGPIVVAVQYAPAIQGNYENWVWTPKVEPTIEYTNWATDLEGIIADDLAVATNTGENLEILGQIRVFNDAAASIRLKPSIGVNWMDLQQIDVVQLNNKDYWVSALTIVQPPTTEMDPWRSQRLINTHSERILALDAANGEIIVSGQSIFNLSDPISLYYGEGGLFAASDHVYIDIPTFQENHLPEYTGPQSYIGDPDYVLTGFERLWFFSGISGQERLQLDFARGDYGDIKMLYLRDIRERVSPILLPDMTVDNDPYLVSDGENLYYALYIYIDRKMPTQYLDYPSQINRFWRIFSVVLINTYNGKIEGYLIESDDDNYVLDLYQDMYTQWDKPIPDWLIPQLRYPEGLFERQIDSYNIYHVSDPDVWQGNTDFFDLTTDSSGQPIEDVRYVTFYLSGTTYWASVRLVEKAGAPGKNIAAMYVVLNAENLGSKFLLRSRDITVIGPQNALDAINTFSPTKSLLSLHPNWISGNLLMYVVNGTLYYFVPYYAQTQTTLSPAMMACVNAISQKVGYYVISNPQDALEVGAASNRAYSDLVGVQLELTATARRNQILDKFSDLGYTLETPKKINANLEFLRGSTSYLVENNWAQTESLITSFIDNWVKPNNLNTILSWETKEANSILLNFGVLVSKEGVVTLNYITIEYFKG